MSNTSLYINCHDCGKNLNEEDIKKHECEYLENDNKNLNTSMRKEMNANATMLKVTKIGGENEKQDSNEVDGNMPTAQHAAEQEMHSKQKSSNDKEFSGQSNDNSDKGKNTSTVEVLSNQKQKEIHRDNKNVKNKELSGPKHETDHENKKSSQSNEYSYSKQDDTHRDNRSSVSKESTEQNHNDDHENKKSSPSNDSLNQKQEDSDTDNTSSRSKESTGQDNEDGHEDKQNSDISDEEEASTAPYPPLSSGSLVGTPEGQTVAQRRSSLPPNAVMKDEPKQAWNANLQRRMSGKVESPGPTKKYRHYPVSCEYCNEKFQPGPLAKHIQEQHPDEHLAPSMRGKGKISPEKRQEEPEDSRSNKKKQKRGGMPRQLRICYICGRQYGSQSLKIHEPNCLEKWRIENEKLPKHKRMPEPVKLEPIKEADSGEKLPGSKGYDQNLPDLNPEAEAAYQSHLRNLVPCDFCRRTFNPDRVMVHQNACIERKQDRRKQK